MEEKFQVDLKNDEVLALCSSVYYYDKPEEENTNEYIRWFILDEQERAFAGGVPLYTEFDIQVDVFTDKYNFNNIGRVIKNTLKEKGYNLIENTNQVIKKGDINLFNKTLRFRYNYYNFN